MDIKKKNINGLQYLEERNKTILIKSHFHARSMLFYSHQQLFRTYLFGQIVSLFVWILLQYIVGCRRSSTGYSQVGPTKVKARKSYILCPTKKVKAYQCNFLVTHRLFHPVNVILKQFQGFAKNIPSCPIGWGVG